MTRSGTSSRTHRTRRALAGLLVAGIGLVPAACGGSALDPVTVRAANEGVAGQLGSGAGTATTGDGTTTAGGAVTGGGAGTGDAGGATGSAGSTGSTGGTAGGTAAGGDGGGAVSGSLKGTGGNAATGAVKAASCAGFKNSTGITDKTITIGNSSDVSGPVPGLFTSAQQATKAYVAYFNATSSICGRKLELKTYDSRTDAGADQQAYQQMCEQTFAAVGSMSAFDSGGAPVAEDCGLPDIRSSGVTAERAACSTCFGALATNAHQFENSVPDFMLKQFPEASKKAAVLYVNAGAAAQNARTQMAVEEKRGMKIIYSAGIDVSEFNYGPYVQAMKDKGVRWVQFLGAYQQAARLAKTMQQSGFEPDAYVLDPTGYNADYVKQAGDAADGTIVFMPMTPFEEASSNRELQLYLTWLNQVAPGAQPSFFGLFSWSAARLFVEQATALGGDLSRQNLVKRLRGVTKWTANGLHAPQPVGSKKASECYRFLRLKGTKWVPFGGSRYLCTGVTTVG
ncbi:MAG TPA: ABC transporter substrate-binding protein [Marmoricola sp.]|jgi:ABC-type branched-subunit amino acid transport system substrate-binding protein|nr:ABC transporter substrate-binding protein [Marmoricola sp.]